MNEQTLTEYLAECDGYGSDSEALEADFWNGVDAGRCGY